MDDTKQDIQWALNSFSERRRDYDLAAAYFNGAHRLDFVPSEFRVDFAQLLRRARLNMCPAVVTSVRDRLKLTGFTHNMKTPETPETEDAEAPDSGIAVTDPAQDRIGAIWRRNRMDQRAGEVHLEALTMGDAYAIVWKSPITGKVTIFPNYARMVTVLYDEEEPDLIALAARSWQMDDGRVALNLYYPDRTEKFITRRKVVSAVGQTTELKAQLFVIAASEEARDGVIDNPYGRVPVFHFGNSAGCGGFGVSELREAIPVQDCLNKTLRDMLIGGEEQALRQRYATGVEFPVDPDTKQPINKFVPGDFWATASKEAKFGELEAANLTQLQAVKEGYKVDMAMVTGTPPYYFYANAGNPPSGESLKTLEQRLTSKVEDRQVAFGNAWEDLMAFALQVDGLADADKISLDAVWANTTPRSETEDINNAAVKMTKLGMPLAQVYRELGYSDEETTRLLAPPLPANTEGLKA